MQKKDVVKWLLIVCLGGLISTASATQEILPPGPLFSVSQSGDIDVIFCLNGKGPMSCQHFNVPNVFTVRTTIKNHTNPIAGMKVNTAGVTIAGIGTSCTPDPKTGYCLFSVSDTQAKSFSLTLTSAVKVAVGSFISEQDKGMAAVKQGSTGSWSFPIPAGYQLAGTSCTGTGATAICTVVGNYLNVSQPVLYVSQNGGSSWQAVTSGIPNAATYYATSCTGSGASAVCTAVGTNNDQAGVFLVSVSRDGGSTWTTATLPPANVFAGRLVTTSCTGSGSSATCVAAGYRSSNNAPVLLISTNGGVTWSNVSVSGYQLTSSSCTGSGGNVMCAVSGPRSSTNGAGLWVYNPVIFTLLGLPAWRNLSFSPVTGVSFSGVSCTGMNLTLCVAAGRNTISSQALLYTSTNGGFSWSSTLTTPPGSSTLNSVACSGVGVDPVTGAPLSRCVAGGVNGSAQQSLLYTSSDGTTWTPVATAAASNSTFNSITCTGEGSSAVCAAAGQNTTQNTSLLYLSQDGGVSWSKESGAELPGSFASTDCVGAGANLVCSAVGSNATRPLIYQSVLSDSIWNLATLPSNLFGLFNASSCSGFGTTGVCLAVGQNASGEVPLLYRGSLNSNGSLQWTEAATGVTTPGSLSSVSCTSQGESSRCTAVGYELTDTGSVSAPILLVSQDNGSTWLRETAAVSSFTASYLYSTSCTGSSASAICVAGGQDRTVAPWPALLLSSRDGGSTWTPINTGGNNAVIDAVSCTGEGNTAVCIATGRDYTSTSSALIYLSQDGAQTWQQLNTAALTSSGEFFGASCSGKQAGQVICTASGMDDNTDLPLVYATRDGGTTWTAQSSLLPAGPASSGAQLNQPACTGEGVNAVCAVPGLYYGDYPSYVYLGQATSTSLVWQLIQPTTYSGYLNVSNCVGSGAYATCMVAGSELKSALYLPSLYLSTNAGATWSAVSLDSTILTGDFNGVSSMTLP